MNQVDIIISGGTILQFDPGDTVIKNGAIAVSGDSIVAVGDHEKVKSSFSARTNIDASGCIVMPGLINTHTHAAMTAFRGIADDMDLMDWWRNYIFPAEAKNVDPELAYWGSMLACAEMILSGTTTFCDMYIFEDETAKAASLAGMRCLIGEVLFDFPSPNVKTPEEGLAYSEMLLDKWRDDPLVNIVVEPHSLYTCSPDLLKKSLLLSERYNAPIATHFLENITEREMIETKIGRSPIEFLDDIGYLNNRFFIFHGVYMGEEEISLFADHGCKVVHNPESNMKLASGVAPVTKMINAGVVIGLGTDGCASNNNLDMFQEMDTAAKLEKSSLLDPKVMSARTVLRMATCDGAKVLGMNNLTGSLVPGKKADIILVNIRKPHLTPMYSEHSHLVYAVMGSDVETVIINGRIVMRDRKLLTLDIDEIMDRMNNIASKIRKSLEN